MKKFLALLISALLAITCGAFMACSTPDDPGNGGGGATPSKLTYEAKFGNSCYYVTGIDAEETSTDIVIPATHNNKPVKGINENAFNADEIGIAITSVTMPASIEFIGAYAFNSSAITSVTIPAAVNEIHQYAFYCDTLQTVTFESTTGWGYLAIGASVNAEAVTVSNATAATKFKTEDNVWADKSNGEPNGWANFVLKK